MKILHIVPGMGDVANGMVVVAKLLAKEQGEAEVVDLNHEIHESGVEEVWVHGMWLPKEWLACWRVLRAGKRLVRMTHGSLSPLYLRHQSPFKKWLVGPIERWCLRRCDRIVATCETEKGWIESYLGRRCPPIELTDIKRFFKLHGEVSTQSRRVAECAESDVRLPSADGGLGQRPRDNSASSRLCVNNKNQDEPLHLLYLGRRHPLKGVEYLETAVAQLTRSPFPRHSLRSAWSLPHGSRPPTRGGYVPHSPQLKVVSNAFGAELEKVWDWCDVLVLPTLSENFGLVIAEALERGKCVITTDGAPAWGEELTGLTGFTGLYSGYEGRLIYLKGYRDGTDEERVELLKKAIDMLKHDGNMV